MGSLQIVQVQKPGFQIVWCEEKNSNCASCSGCVKNVKNEQYLHVPKDVEEAFANPKAHWDGLEDRKVRLHGVETRLQGQRPLDECVEEYKRGSSKRKCCMVTWHDSV